MKGSTLSFKRGLSAITAILLIVSLLPIAAFADSPAALNLSFEEKSSYASDQWSGEGIGEGSGERSDQGASEWISAANSTTDSTADDSEEYYETPFNSDSAAEFESESRYEEESEGDDAAWVDEQGDKLWAESEDGESAFAPLEFEPMATNVEIMVSLMDYGRYTGTGAWIGRTWPGAGAGFWLVLTAADGSATPATYDTRIPAQGNYNPTTGIATFASLDPGTYYLTANTSTVGGNQYSLPDYPVITATVAADGSVTIDDNYGIERGSSHYNGGTSIATPFENNELFLKRAASHVNIRFESEYTIYVNGAAHTIKAQPQASYQADGVTKYLTLEVIAGGVVTASRTWPGVGTGAAWGFNNNGADGYEYQFGDNAPDGTAFPSMGATLPNDIPPSQFRIRNICLELDQAALAAEFGSIWTSLFEDLKVVDADGSIHYRVFIDEYTPTQNLCTSGQGEVGAGDGSPLDAPKHYFQASGYDFGIAADELTRGKLIIDKYVWDDFGKTAPADDEGAKFTYSIYQVIDGVQASEVAWGIWGSDPNPRPLKNVEIVIDSSMPATSGYLNYGSVAISGLGRGTYRIYETNEGENGYSMIVDGTVDESGHFIPVLVVNKEDDDIPVATFNNAKKATIRIAKQVVAPDGTTGLPREYFFNIYEMPYDPESSIPIYEDIKVSDGETVVIPDPDNRFIAGRSYIVVEDEARAQVPGLTLEVRASPEGWVITLPEDETSGANLVTVTNIYRSFFDVQVEKDTINRTSAAYSSTDQGISAEGVENVGNEYYIYEIDFRSLADVALDDFEVYDPLEYVNEGKIRVDELWTPVVYGDLVDPLGADASGAALYDIYYQTNLDPTWTWWASPSSSFSERLSVDDLYNSGILDETNDEHITALYFDFGSVDAWFTSRNYNRNRINDYTDSAIGTASIEPPPAGLAPLAQASASASLQSFIPFDEELDRNDWVTLNDLDDDYDNLLPITYVVHANTALQDVTADNIVGSANVIGVLGDLSATDADAVLTRNLIATATSGSFQTFADENDPEGIEPFATGGELEPVGETRYIRSTLPSTGDSSAPSLLVALAALAAGVVLLLGVRRRRARLAHGLSLLLILALVSTSVMIQPSKAEAAPGDPSVNVTVEFLYDEGANVTVPQTVERFGRVYGLVSQEPPAWVSAQSRHYTFSIQGGFTLAQLNQWKTEMLSSGTLSSEVASQIVPAGSPDAMVTFEDIIGIDISNTTNDVNALDTAIASYVGSSYTDPGSGKTYTGLQRVLNLGGVEHNGYTPAASTGRPSLTTESYTATVYFRGRTTEPGYNNLTVIYGDSSNPLDRYVIIATYEPLNVPPGDIVYITVPGTIGGATTVVAPGGAAGAGGGAAAVATDTTTIPATDTPTAAPGTTTNTGSETTGTDNTTITEPAAPLTPSNADSSSFSLPWWAFVLIAILVVAVIIAAIAYSRRTKKNAA